jgi:hypothetical protein
MESESTEMSLLSIIGWGINMILAFLLINCALASCSYNITLAHTEGSASDLIDEVSTNTPTLSANVKMPGVI